MTDPIPDFQSITLSNIVGDVVPVLTVRRTPGATALTRIFGAAITARDLTRCICAAFVTAYG